MYTLAMCYMQNFTVTIVGSTSNHLDFCFSEHQLAWFQNRAAKRSSKLVSCDYWAYLFSWILLPELRWSNWIKKRKVACHHGSQEWRTNLAARASWWAHVSSMGKTWKPLLSHSTTLYKRYFIHELCSDTRFVLFYIHTNSGVFRTTNRLVLGSTWALPRI